MPVKIIFGVDELSDDLQKFQDKVNDFIIGKTISDIKYNTIHIGSGTVYHYAYIEWEGP